MRITLIVVLATLAACGGGNKPAADTSSASAAATGLAPTTGDTTGERADTGAKRPPPCPRTGRWELCNVEKRLAESGFVPRRVDDVTPRRPGFSVPPVVYTLGRSRLEIFLYNDEQSVGRDFARLDSATAAPVGTRSVWTNRPVLVRSANLAAVFLTDNSQRAERLVLALTAGPPQRNAQQRNADPGR